MLRYSWSAAVMLVLCPLLLKTLSCLCMQGVCTANGTGSLAILKYSQEYSGTQIQHITSVACRLRI